MKKNNRLLKITILLFIISVFLIESIAVSAVTVSDSLIEKESLRFETFLGKAGYQPILASPTLTKLIASIVRYLFSFLGVIFVILIIYSGFLWMTASGDEEQITKAKDIMQSSVIGLVIILMSSVITYSILPVFLS